MRCIADGGGGRRPRAGATGERERRRTAVAQAGRGDQNTADGAAGAAAENGRRRGGGRRSATRDGDRWSHGVSLIARGQGEAGCTHTERGRGGGGRAVERWAATVGRETVAPLELVQLGVAGVVAAVAQGHLFIQRIAGQQHLQIAFVEGRIDLDHLHGNWIRRIGESLAVFKHQRDVARAFARRAQGVTVDRRVGIGDVGQRGLVDRALVFGRIHHIGAGHRAAFAEGGQLGAQAVDRRIPLAFVRGVGRRAEVFQLGEVGRSQHVEVEVILACGFINELTLEGERAFAARVGVEVKTLLQMRRQLLEVGFARVVAGQDRRRDRRQIAAAQQESFGAGRIVQQHAVVAEAGVGDGLLVIDLRTGGTAHLRQRAGDRARLGHGQRLRLLQHRHDLLLGDR